MKKNYKVWFVSTFVPRECGIATFTNNLIGAVKAARPHTRFAVTAISDRDYNYPPVVKDAI